MVDRKRQSRLKTDDIYWELIFLWLYPVMRKFLKKVFLVFLVLWISSMCTVWLIILMYDDVSFSDVRGHYRIDPCCCRGVRIDESVVNLYRVR